VPLGRFVWPMHRSTWLDWGTSDVIWSDLIERCHWIWSAWIDWIFRPGLKSLTWCDLEAPSPWKKDVFRYSVISWRLTVSISKSPTIRKKLIFHLA
jgi:hypothetical protein